MPVGRRAGGDSVLGATGARDADSGALSGCIRLVVIPVDVLPVLAAEHVEDQRTRVVVRGLEPRGVYAATGLARSGPDAGQD